MPFATSRCACSTASTSASFPLKGPEPTGSQPLKLDFDGEYGLTDHTSVHGHRDRRTVVSSCL